jgi:hypothetical protein
VAFASIEVCPLAGRPQRHLEAKDMIVIVLSRSRTRKRTGRSLSASVITKLRAC